MQRAARTCELAGFGPVAVIDRDLVEWDYGDYEGVARARSAPSVPAGRCFATVARAANRLQQVGARADRVVGRLRAVDGDVLLFSSGHFLRVLAARWLGLDPAGGRHFLLGTASLSALGYEHDLSQPIVRLWNDTRHVDT